MLNIIYKYSFLGIIVGILTAIIAYFFFNSLNWAIDFRKSHSWLILFLPMIGLFVAWIYQRYGNEVSEGNNLILDEIERPAKIIKFRMVPMIFISSTLSHLFGASVGREGAAVQMGAGISDQFSHYFGHFFNNRPIVLMVGIAAGFSAIFGTPIAGAVFALEILKIGPNHYKALIPCLVSAFIGFYCGKYLGIHYSHFDINFFPIISISSLLLIIISGLIFGWIARFFLWLLHAVKEILKQKIPKIIFRPFFGGIFIVLIFYLFKTDRYLSLGEDIIHLSFIDHVYPWDFIGKIMTTVISVGSGFRGGEVMSLFYIGATLGNALSYVIPFSISFLSSLGFVSVFSSAANTPIAGIFLAVQVFGIKFGLWAALSIMVAYLVSGKNGLFKSNRKHRYKLH